MIKTPPQHNTENPPGQITYRPKQGLYLRDVIKRIQSEEERQASNRAYGQALAARAKEDLSEPMKLPTPIAGPAKALADLKQALLAYCRGAREHATPQERVFIEDIRKIISESR